MTERTGRVTKTFEDLETQVMTLQNRYDTLLERLESVEANLVLDQAHIVQRNADRKILDAITTLGDEMKDFARKSSRKILAQVLNAFEVSTKKTKPKKMAKIRAALLFVTGAPS
jgi:hypothetical protein